MTDDTASGPAPIAARVVYVIPSWNGREFLDDVLTSLAEQELDEGDTAVLVVDNGSTDDSLSLLGSRWPSAHVIALPENAGFAAAVNRGIEASDGEYVAVLNNDVRLAPEWTRTLVAELERAPNAASATGKVLSAQQPDVLDGAGDIVGWDGYCVRRGRGERDQGQYDRSGLVFSACAAAALYRRAAFEEVGPFDERFFIYIEDVDWGFRAQIAGYDCVYEPRALAYHWGGGATGALAGFELYLCHRNMIQMMIKDFPLPALALHLPLALGRRLASFVRAARQRHAATILKAWIAALGLLPGSLRERRRIQRGRARGYRQLAKLVPPRAPVQR